MNQDKRCHYITEKLLESWTASGEKILLLVSKQDGAFCMTCTSGIREILTPPRMDDIVQVMDDRNWKWDDDDLYEGVMYSINRISHYVDEGRPTFFENYSWYLLIAIVMICYCFEPNHGNGQSTYRIPLFVNMGERVYHHRELNEEEKTEATLLMNKYECYSCPICLEDFTSTPSSSGDQCDYAGNDIYNGNKKFIGSDNSPIKLMRCGHSTCQRCWNEWIHAKSDSRLCPVCKKDIGG